jgi:hypothetical protein
MAMRQNSLRILLHKFALISLLLVLVCSCQDKKLQERFDTVERIVSDYPDSAMQLLNEVKERKFGTSEQARYDLLTAEARYMSGENDTIPGRLTEIAEYYDRKGDSHNAARAYYYEGIIYQNTSKHGDALVSLLKAEKRCHADNHQFRGLLYRSLGDCMASIMDWKGALRYKQQALSEFKKLNGSKYLGYAYFEVADAEYCISNYDSAIAHALSAYKYGIKCPIDSSLISHSIRVQAISYLSKDSAAKAIILYNQLIDNYPNYVESQDYNKLGIAYLNVGNTHAAEIALENQQALAIQGDAFDRELSINLKYLNHEYQAAFLSLCDVQKEVNYNIDRAYVKDYSGIASAYYKTEETLLEQQVIQEHRNKAMLIAIALIAIIIIVLVSYRIIIHQKLEAKKKLTTILALQDDLERARISIERESIDCAEAKKENNELSQLAANNNRIADLMKQSILELLAQPIKILETLCVELENKENNKHGEKPDPSRIVKKAVNVVENLRSLQFNENLEKYIDLHFDNILKNFANDFPSKTNSDKFLLMYNIIGLSSSTIATLLQIDTDTLYRRKYKLKQKIKASDSPHAALYLNTIN